MHGSLNGVASLCVPSTLNSLLLTHSTHLPLHKAHILHNLCCSLPFQRLKTRFIAAHSSSGHHLFISAFTMPPRPSTTTLTPTSPGALSVGGMFALREINQMECEMRSYLEWQLNIEPTTLKEFVTMVCKYFKGPGSCSAHYTLPAPSSTVRISKTKHEQHTHPHCHLGLIRHHHLRLIHQ